MTCPYCETGNHPVAECPVRLEEYHGVPDDHFDGDDEDDDREVATDGGQLEDKGRRIKFAPEFAPDIVEGEKTATVRYDGFEGVQPGDTLQAFTPIGNRFADLRVTRTATVNAIEAHDVLEALAAEYPSEEPGDVVASLNQFYRDLIRPETAVRVLVFEVIR